MYESQFFLETKRKDESDAMRRIESPVTFWNRENGQLVMHDATLNTIVVSDFLNKVPMWINLT